MNLRKKCDTLESSKQEAVNSAREVSERYERLRSRTSELEDDYKEEIRTYRARLEMTDKRCNALEREVNTDTLIFLCFVEKFVSHIRL